MTFLSELASEGELESSVDCARIPEKLEHRRSKLAGFRSPGTPGNGKFSLFLVSTNLSHGCGILKYYRELGKWDG